MHLDNKKILAGVVLSSAIILSDGTFSEPVLAAQTSVNVRVNIEQESYADWTNGVEPEVVAVGIAPKDPRSMALAREAAIMSAQRTLLGTIKEIRIDSDTVMRDFMIEHDLVNRKINGIIRGAQVVEERPLEDGGYYVKMRVLIFGKNSSIASAIIPEIVPENPTPFESVTQPSINRSEVREVQSAGYTGVIVDASGLGVEPTFSPVIYDTSGRAIYGIANLNEESIVERGMVSYSTSTSDEIALQRAGSNPLIVRAAEMRGGDNSANSVNAVISVEDADRILLANEKTHMLENCAVVFVK